MSDIHLNAYQPFIARKGGVSVRFPCSKHEYHCFTAFSSGDLSPVLSNQDVKLPSH